MAKKKAQKKKAKANSKAKPSSKPKASKPKARKKAARKKTGKKKAGKKATSFAQKPHITKKATSKKARKKSGKPRSKAVAKPVAKAAKAPRRTMRLKITATAKYAGMAEGVRIRTNSGGIADVKLNGRIGYQAGTAIFTPGDDSRQQLPFDIPGQVKGEKKGEVLSITYRWGGMTYTHSFNGRLPKWIGLPGGVYAAVGLAFTHAQGFRDAK